MTTLLSSCKPRSVFAGGSSLKIQIIELEKNNVFAKSHAGSKISNLNNVDIYCIIMYDIYEGTISIYVFSEIEAFLKLLGNSFLP